MQSFDFRTTLPLLKYPDSEELSTVSRQADLDYQTQNRSAVIVGSFRSLTPEQITSRYPRIIQGILYRGYYSEWEAARMIKEYRLMRRCNRSSAYEREIQNAVLKIRGNW